MAKFESPRTNEAYLYGLRNQRKDDYQAWHDRIDAVDALIRGEYWVVYPDQQSDGQQPVIMNLADIVPREVAKLGNESSPSYTAYARGDSEPAERNRDVRQVIGQGYFTDYGPWIDIFENLIMDLVITGACFMSYWVNANDEYPRYNRLDPRFCFPDIQNGQLQDLLVIQPMKLRVADRLYPDANLLRRAPKHDASDVVEIWDYIGPETWQKGVAYLGDSGQVTSENGVTLISSEKHRLDRLPATMGLIPSPDGALRGTLDQVGPSLIAKNRAVELMLEYEHELVYSPFEARGIINASQPPGPTTIYQHDPTVQGETFMRRVAPGGMNPELFSLVEYLDQEERGSLAYPQTRQGTVPQSQGSASFVTSTQGQLTSMVKQSLRALAGVQERGAAAMYAIDETWLDFEKPMCTSVGRKTMYTPSKDIHGERRLKVSYGAGAGLDRLNTDVRLFNAFSAGVISDLKVLEELDYIENAQNEINRREAMEARRIILQRFEGDMQIPVDAILASYEYQQKHGGSLIDAALAVQALGQSFSQPTAEAAPAAPGEVPQGAPPGTEPSGAPGAAAPQNVPPQFAPPPMQETFPRYAGA